jgi:hypothetical protein
MSTTPQPFNGNSRGIREGTEQMKHWTSRARARDRGNDLAMKPNLAPPARATLVDEWDNIGAAFRAFDGPEWRIKHTTGHGRRADIVVSVVGLQYADGHALCEVVLDCPDTPIITSAQARKLGRALIAAADAAEASGWA